MAGPIVLDPTLAATGAVSVQYLRRELGRRLGPYVVTQTARRPSTATADAAFQVVAEILKSEGQSAGRLDERYVYVASGAQAGAQRKLLGGGHDDREGISLTDAPFDAPLEQAVEIEISAPLPVGPWGDLSCLNEIVERALDRMTVILNIGLIAEPPQVRFPLPMLGLPIAAAQIIDVYGPAPIGLPLSACWPRLLSRSAWSLEYDGEAPYLLIGCTAPADSTFWVKVSRRASSWVCHEGVWAARTTAPLADDDQVVAEPVSVAAVGLPLAYERLARYWGERGDPRAASYQSWLEETRTASAFARFYGSPRRHAAQRVALR